MKRTCSACGIELQDNQDSCPKCGGTRLDVSIKVDLPSHEEIAAKALVQVLAERGIEATVEFGPSRTLPPVAPQSKALEAAEKATALLRKRDGVGAMALLTRYELENPGLHVNWANPEIGGATASALWLLRSNCHELSNDGAYRSALSLELAWADLYGETVPEAIRRITNQFGERFRCHDLERFAEAAPRELAWRLFEDEEPCPENLAAVYVQTKLSAAKCESSLANFMSLPSCIGVEILADGDCRLCCDAKLIYRWAELGVRSPLPTHWGCTCCYIPLLDEPVI